MTDSRVCLPSLSWRTIFPTRFSQSELALLLNWATCFPVELQWIAATMISPDCPLRLCFFMRNFGLSPCVLFAFFLGCDLASGCFRLACNRFCPWCFVAYARHQDDKIVPACAKVKTGGMGCSDVLWVEFFVDFLRKASYCGQHKL